MRYMTTGLLNLPSILDSQFSALFLTVYVQHVEVFTVRFWAVYFTNRMTFSIINKLRRKISLNYQKFRRMIAFSRSWEARWWLHTNAPGRQSVWRYSFRKIRRNRRLCSHNIFTRSTRWGSCKWQSLESASTQVFYKCQKTWKSSLTYSKNTHSSKENVRTWKEIKWFTDV